MAESDITTYPIPPSTFDLSRASNADLSKYGIPILPAAPPDVATRWNARLQSPFTIVSAEFSAYPIAKGKIRWAGGILGPASENRVKWIEGAWVIPKAVRPPGGVSQRAYLTSTWIGIDGADAPVDVSLPSKDVLQAGCDLSVSPSGSVDRIPWFQWYPDESVKITNFPLFAGEELNILILGPDAEGDAASLLFCNRNRRVTTLLSAKASADSASLFRGYSAEWIVESLNDIDGVPQLARFDPFQFTNCNSGADDGTVLSLDPQFKKDIFDINGNRYVAGAVVVGSKVSVSYTHVPSSSNA